MVQDYSNLRQKTISGIQWNAISQATGLILTVFGSIVLSRILNPSLFGLFAMITVLGNFINIVIGLGFSHAIIQNRDLDRNDFVSFFWLNIILGGITSISFYFFAPLVTSFYEQPELLNVARAFSSVFVIASAAIVPSAILARELNFRTLAASNILAFLLSYGGALLLGYKGFGIWALMFQYIMFQSTTLILNLYFSSWWPTFRFQKTSFAKIRKFTTRLLPTQILDYFTSNLDIVLVGKVFGKTELGIYGRAQGIIMMPVNNLSILLSRSFFSVFSILQHDLLQLKVNYTNSAKLIVIIITPVLISVALVPEEFVLIVFGEQWIEMSPLLPVMCAAGIIGSFNALNDGLYTSQGRPDILLRVVFAEKIVLVVFIVIGVFYGLLGVAYAKLFAQMFSLVLRVNQQKRVIDVSFRFWAKSFMKIALSSAAMILALIFFRPFITDFALILRFVTAVGIAMTSFFLSLLILREEMLYKLRGVIYDIWKAKK